MSSSMPSPSLSRFDPHIWQADIHQLWEQGQRQAAIDRLLQRINTHQPAVPRALGLQLIYYIFLLGDLKEAERFLRMLLQVHPDDLEIQENLAVMLSRQGRAAEAIPCFEHVLARDARLANAWDGLTACLAEEKRYDEAVRSGERSLALKTETARPLEHWQPPTTTPRAYLERPGLEARRDVVSFSIWGANPRYLRGALRNALLIPDLYPGWQARFYLDETVPEDFRALLAQLGADCRLMPAGHNLRQRLCWRFLVANDPAVGRFLVRDCDAVVNQREVAAVQQWLASKHWFHVMRDWWTHTDPILAGLWGGIAGVLPELAPLLASYSPAAKETANVDQWFLRDVLWGSIRPLALIHDRCFRSEGSQPWPTATPSGNRHVGQDEFAVNREGQATWLAGWLQRYPCLQLQGEDPFALTKVQDPDLDRYVLARSPGPLCADRQVPMPDHVSGWIINLSDAQERWQLMAEQIEQLGWGRTHRRFEAHSASQAEAEALGLRSAGQLGLWRSTTALLQQWLESDPLDHGLLHIIEDDAVLNAGLPQLLEPFSECQPQLDLLFTEAFLTVPLYQRLRQLEQQRQQGGEGIVFLNGGLYLACTSSMLLSRDGAERLLLEMRKAESGPTLPVSDMFYRQLIRTGRLNAAISLPFFSTIRIEQNSWIQEHRMQKIKSSQQLDLHLRRLLYYETWEPHQCQECMLSLANVLSHCLMPSQIGDYAAELLKYGRARGWLHAY